MKIYRFRKAKAEALNKNDRNIIRNTILDVERQKFGLDNRYDDPNSNRSKSIIRIGDRDLLDVTKLSKHHDQLESIIKLLERNQSEPRIDPKEGSKERKSILNLEHFEPTKLRSNKEDDRNRSVPSIRELTSGISPMKKNLGRI